MAKLINSPHYLMPTEEFDRLVAAAKRIQTPQYHDLLALCMLAAQTVPVVPTGWHMQAAEGSVTMRNKAPWGCILAQGNDKRAESCAGCPSLKACPHPSKVLA